MTAECDELENLFIAYGVGHVDSRVLAEAMIQIGYRKVAQEDPWPA